MPKATGKKMTKVEKLRAIKRAKIKKYVAIGVLIIIIYILLVLFVAFDCQVTNWFHEPCLWSLKFNLFPPGCKCVP